MASDAMAAARFRVEESNEVEPVVLPNTTALRIVSMFGSLRDRAHRYPQKRQKSIEDHFLYLPRSMCILSPGIRESV